MTLHIAIMYGAGAGDLRQQIAETPRRAAGSAQPIASDGVAGGAR